MRTSRTTTRRAEARALVLRFAGGVLLLRLGLALAGATAALALGGALDRAGASLEEFSLLEDRLVLHAFFAGALMLVASGLAFSLTAGRPSSRSAVWRAAAVALMVLGIDELASVHELVESWAGVPWALAFMPVAVVALAACLAAALAGGGGAAARALLATAVLAFASAQALEGLDSVRGELAPAARAAKELLEVVGAALAVSGLVAAVQFRRPGALPAGERLGLRPLADRLVALVDLRALAIAVCACIAVLIGAGLIADLDGVDLRSFDLNAEQTVPAYFTGGLIVASSGICLLCLLFERRHGRPGWDWAAIALFFAFMAVDEVLEVHERVQFKLDLNGQLVLLPVILVGGVAWLFILRRLVDRRARLMWIAGAAAWFASQVVDALHEPGDDRGYLIAPEELFEMSGGTLFAFAVLIWLRSALSRDDRAQEGEHARPTSARARVPVAAGDVRPDLHRG